jgi:NitT/TauT family transport system substrate-binding protein
MRFARASRRGWEWAADHREETVEIVMEYVKREYAATNRVLQQLMLDEILRLQLAKDTGEREFRLRPEMVEAASELMYKNGMIRRPVKLEELLP